MEDRYLFRAKRIDNGEWVEGMPLEIEGKTMMLIRDDENMWTAEVYCVEVDSSTICRCIGSRDKNGKLIWENDIVNCIEAECCGRIVWNESEAGFYFDVLLVDETYEEEHIYDYVDCMDVIGNVFDNPELLEVQE
jgi:uncharacterized phage protein (TIGR01671 family)